MGKSVFWRRIVTRWLRWLNVRLLRLATRRPGHQRLGRLGERLARRALVELGLEILESNFRGAYGGEVDIVARDGDEVCFVEVKTRHRMRFGRPADAVDGTRRLRQIRAGEYYCGKIAPDVKLRHRFDIMEVVFDGWRLAEINYIRHAYQKTAGTRM